MITLILGLLIFLGIHSIRIFSDDFRNAQIARIGLPRWKGVYAVASALGFVLIIWGFGLARQQPLLLWTAPIWARHAAGALMVLAFVLLVAAYVPRNHLKTAIGHPMLAAVKVWAVAHLIANGRLADLVLFGSFLVWAIVLFAVSRRRDRRAGTQYPAGTLRGDAIVIVVSIVAWAVFAFYLHGWLIGVRPFG